MPEFRTQRPLPREREECVENKLEGRRCPVRLIEDRKHFVPETFAERGRMQVERATVKRAEHQALRGLATRRRSRASRTTSARRAVSAVRTPRPTDVRR